MVAPSDTMNAVPPCGGPEHKWELVLRCVQCGFLIRVGEKCGEEVLDLLIQSCTCPPENHD